MQIRYSNSAHKHILDCEGTTEINKAEKGMKGQNGRWAIFFIGQMIFEIYFIKLFGL